LKNEYFKKDKEPVNILIRSAEPNPEYALAKCLCGEIFTVDAVFCGSCGKKRPSQHDLELEIKLA
jgi:hypothetical protein